MTRISHALKKSQDANLETGPSRYADRQTEAYLTVDPLNLLADAALRAEWFQQRGLDESMRKKWRVER